MNDAERWAEARRWLIYAEEDLAAARALSESGAARHVCWLAQQAAEKTLKAILVFLQTDFPFWHDLDALRNLIPEGWRVKQGYPDLAELTQWAVESRYPGNWPTAGEHDSEAAIEQARGIYQSVCRDFERLGYALDEHGS